jgi:hypothetical protein
MANALIASRDKYFSFIKYLFIFTVTTSIKNKTMDHSQTRIGSLVKLGKA